MEHVSEELILDQIKEIFNLGVGKASHEIGFLVGEEVMLDVPHAVIVSRLDAKSNFNISKDENITAIFQAFSGDLEGEAMLLFHGERSLELVRYLLNEESSLQEMTELDEEAIGDIASIIVNNLLMTMHKVLSINLSTSLPNCVHGEFKTVLSRLFGAHLDCDDKLLSVTISFRFNEKDLEGQLIFIQELRLAEPFFAYVETYLNEGFF